jgi:hypothetical protein
MSDPFLIPSTRRVIPLFPGGERSSEEPSRGPHACSCRIDAGPFRLPLTIHRGIWGNTTGRVPARMVITDVKNVLWRTRHERSFAPGSSQLHEIEGFPPQGISRARRGRDVLQPRSPEVFPELIRRTGSPFGGGGVHRAEERGCESSIHHIRLIQFSGEIMRTYGTLPGLRPAAGALWLR